MAKTYLKLSEYYEFVKWYATPRGYRIPQTQEGFSEVYGVGHDTLARWKADPNFKEDVRRVLFEWTHNLVPDVVGAVYNTALAGDVKAQTLFMKYFSTLPNPDKPTAGELQSQGETLADVLLQRLKERQARGAEPIHYDARQNTISGGN